MDEYTINEVELLLNTSINHGLSHSQAKQRLERDGMNEIISKAKKSTWMIFLEQFKEPMVYILFVGAFLSLILGEHIDSLIICFVVVLNACIGTFQLVKSEKALEALSNLMQPSCHIMRDSQVYEMNTKEIVVGDMIEFEAGDRIPCDIRLTHTSSLSVDESLLTGESQSVIKNEYYRSLKKTPLSEKHNMVFMSTYVSSGRGKGIAVSCGMNSEMGQIASLLNEENNEITHLQKRMNDLGKMLGLVAIFICLAMMIVSINNGKRPLEMLLLAISLAVAAIPEGLPAVVTIVQSLGISQMSQNKAIVRKLSAVETLGSVNVICTDKTGTLTQNKMSVVSTYFNHSFDDKVPEMALACMGCAHNVAIHQEPLLGDSSEKALVEFVKDKISLQTLQCDYLRIDEIPFDSNRKKMSTIHQKNHEQFVFTKGSLEQILKQCSHIQINDKTILLNEYERKRIIEACTIMEEKALRVFGLCMKKSTLTCKDYETNSVFLGIVGLKDPIKKEVKEAISKAKRAGIDVVMISGDSLKTAFAIGKECGIVDYEKQVLSGEDIDSCSDFELQEKLTDIKVFARVSPVHKVRLVEAYQKLGKIVAMSGDGVNDAPALKKADVGIAMGKGGSDVCKSVSDMVLMDDNFQTIILAIEAGRNIYLKVQKSVYYLLSCNLGEIMCVFCASILMNHLVSPLCAIQLLWTNLVTDAFPALALGVEKDEKDVMSKKPKKINENLFAHGGFSFVLLNGCFIGLISLVAFKLGYQKSALCGQTMAFMVLSLSQMFHSLNCRNIHQSMFKIGFLKNKWLMLTIVCGISLQILVCQLPFMNYLLKTISLSLSQWSIVFGLSISTIIINEVSKLFN
ncbi:MAG: cation-translocating P-type ATPase [Traorella sp.]